MAKLDWVNSAISDEEFSQEEQQIINEINRRAALHSSIVDLIEFLFQSISPFLPCDRIGLAFIEEKGRRLVGYHTVSRSSDVMLGKGFAQDLKGSSLEAVIRDGRPRVINDLEAYRASHPNSASTALILREGWKSSMTCPLVVDRRPIGALFFNAALANAYEAHHVRLQQAIAERLSQAAENAYRIEQLETIHKAYQEVLGFVAHELKNPVASMVTNARLLCDGYVGEITPQQRQKIERIAYNGQYLIGFIESYLDLAKVENAETSPAMVEISSLADEVIRPAIELLHGQIEGRRMKLDIKVPDQPVVASGNAELLRVVLVNLVGNALKYGRELGRIRVDLAVEGGQGEVSVWNEGPGFPPQKRADLFQRFVRQNTPELIRRKGTGLGLYTCWKIIQLHEGRIWADSELGAWARFSFRIPVQPAAAATVGIPSL